jgi:beta-galactosidase
MSDQNPQAPGWPPTNLPGILYGGDYNPEQWTPQMGYEGESVWLEDMRLMREAGINVATVGVFSWASLQPREGVYTFEWLDRVMDLLAENGIFACLGTGTAAQPAWLSQAHPEILPVDEWGRKRRHGERLNYCPSSPVYRRYAAEQVRQVAQRYHDHPALLLWHIGNEYGPDCYCDSCAARFREWLQARYGTPDNLNMRWVTPFWGHTFTDWSQIEPPSRLGEKSTQGMSLDYKRFMSDMNLECFRQEAAILREIRPDVLLTTNFHGSQAPVKNLDYFAWAPHEDIVAWDSYPGPEQPPDSVAFMQDLIRGLKAGQPWLLMEQTPSQTQWRDFNPLKRPGEMRFQSYQALARGSDAAMFFQWRQSRGSSEMHHGAIVSHAGHSKTRVFQEVETLGSELRELGRQFLGSRIEARVALMFSWPNWWAVEYRPGLSGALDYVDEVGRYYSALWRRNIAVDVISPDSPLNKYDLVISPLLYMVSEEQGTSIGQYVANGGAFLTTYFSGVVDESGRAWLGGAPGPLRKTLGIWVEEVDPLLPGKQKSVNVAAGGRGIEPGTYECDLWCEVVHLEGASALATFEEDFYAGRPAITEHSSGQGKAYYVATRPCARLLEAVVRSLLEERSIVAPLDAPEGVEVTRRTGEGGDFYFVLNHSATEQAVTLPEPMVDLLTGQPHEGMLRLGGRGVAILHP